MEQAQQVPKSALSERGVLHVVVFSDDGNYPTDWPVLITNNKELADALVDRLHWAIREYLSLANEDKEKPNEVQSFFDERMNEENFNRTFGVALADFPRALGIVRNIVSGTIKPNLLDAYRITVDDPLVIYWGGVVKNEGRVEWE